MKYIDYFNNFYIAPRKSGLIENGTKEKLPEFLLKAGLEGKYQVGFPDSGSAYSKWNGINRNPKATVWSSISGHFDRNKFINKVILDINHNVLGEVMTRFGIEIGDEDDIDVDAFVTALAEQLLALARGNGTATNIMKPTYAKGGRKNTFPEYVRKARKRYGRVDMQIEGAVPYGLQDVFVCSTLGSSTNMAMRTTEQSQVSLGNESNPVTLDDIKRYSKTVILIGNGGSGKSMMLQHLFLDSLNHHSFTGVLPVFVELRYFRFNEKNLIKTIVASARKCDESIDEDTVVKLMSVGKCQILMDGLDEVDEGDVSDFQRQLFDTSLKYPESQYILTSRECAGQRAIKFQRLYLQPFDEKQTLALIGNLLKYKEGISQDAIVDYMKHGFLKKHGVFATNPMLLTFLIDKFPIIESFDGKQHLFFESAYETIVMGHDIEKVSYDRIFHSVKDCDEFTAVFREFSAMTYQNAISSLDSSKFSYYFERLKRKMSSGDTLEQPAMLKKQSFIHDACVTACMMYEERNKHFYLDTGFQEYLFAEYCYNEEPEELKAVGKKLWGIHRTKFEGESAFDMLYELSPEKAIICWIIPYLAEIFSVESEVAQFIQFLKMGFRRITFATKSDADAVTESAIPGWVGTNAPSNVILALILRVLDIDESFQCIFNDSAVRRFYPSNDRDVTLAESSVMVANGPWFPDRIQGEIQPQKFIDDYDTWGDLLAMIKETEAGRIFAVLGQYYKELLTEYGEEYFPELINGGNAR